MRSIDGFSLLSENLQNEVRRAGNLPSLQGCRFFGHSAEHKNEVSVLRKRFNAYDCDRSDVLDKSELNQFFKDLDDSMNEQELEKALARSSHKTASCSTRRALLTPQLSPGSRPYRCGQGT